MDLLWLKLYLGSLICRRRLISNAYSDVVAKAEADGDVDEDGEANKDGNTDAVRVADADVDGEDTKFRFISNDLCSYWEDLPPRAADGSVRTTERGVFQFHPLLLIVR